MREIIQSISDYLSQSGVDWFSLSQAMDGNLIAIGMLLAGSITLCVSFMTVSGLSISSVAKSGFFSEAHKRLVIWFLMFLFLCGASFGMQAVVLFYPFYWVYAGIVCVASVASILTCVLYTRHFKELGNIPTPKQIIELQKHNEILEKRIFLLKEHLEVWSQNVGFHISMLKNEHATLLQEVHESTPPDPTELAKEEEVRLKVLETLAKIKEELSSLTELMK